MLGAALALVGGAELLHRRASRSSPQPPRPPCAVVVLGFGQRRDGPLHPVGRWRVEIAVRTLAAVGGDGVLVLSGGRPRGTGASEAARMADHARRLGVPVERLVLEERSTSTVENVAESLALPAVAAAATIAFASDPLHAARARRIAADLRPDLAGRLAGALDHRPLERLGLKVATAGYEVLVPVWFAVRRWPTPPSVG